MRYRSLPAAVALAAFLTVSAEAGQEPPPPWPKIAEFTPGKESRFRLPFFAGLYTYPNNEPMYHVLFVPAGYDPERKYPLIIRYQGQNGAPGVSPFRDVAGRNGGAIVLGMSYVLSKPFSEGGAWTTITGEDYWDAAVARWVMSNFSVDRSRVFVGGFSAGGWAAASNGMRDTMRHVSTHFVVAGSGLRGDYKLQLFKGRPAFVTAGTKGMNHGSAVSAASTLRGAGFEVTFFEEEGIGHTMGPKMKQALIEWWDGFDPAVKGDEWMTRAAALGKRNRAEACGLYARVAALGPNDPRGRAAREKLVELEGEALEGYEAAYELLRSRRYVEATKAFRSAYRQASRKRAARLLKLCQARLEEIAEWQFCEHIMAMEEAYFTGRIYESWLLAQDGALRYARAPSTKRWAQVFKKEAKKLTGDAAVYAGRNIGRARTQQKLVVARIAIWTGKYDSAKKLLKGVVEKHASEPEGADATMLLEWIAALGKDG